MADSGEGPSDLKRSRGAKKLYSLYRPADLKELERILMESEDEDFLEDEPEAVDSDDEYILESGNPDHEEVMTSNEFVGDNPNSGNDEDPEETSPPCSVIKCKRPKLTEPQNPRWSENISNMQKINFIGKMRFLVIPEGLHPIDFFNLLVDKNFYEIISEETNRYAEEVFLASTMLPYSRISRWREVTTDELRVFFGVFLHMGTIATNRLQDYWKISGLFSIPFFAQSMSRDRFLLMMRCLHFARNPGEGDPKPEYRLFKIRPFIEYLNKKMDEIYYPDKNLSLDESMVLWRGRLSFRQYIKNKRHKYGVKLYMLTEPDGTILKFSVYTGLLDDFGGKGHAANVVINLMERRLDVGHALYMDNYYNSYDLAVKLLHRQTYCTGTLRVDRKHTPVEVKTQKLKKGKTLFRCSEAGVLIGKWRDKREVSYISTEFTNEMIAYHDKMDRQRKKPNPVFQYNKYMGGVDRQDQLTAYYPCERKTLRWSRKLGLHILQMLLLNSYLLFKKYTKSKISIYDFRLSVIESLVPEKPFSSTRAKDVNHFPQKNPVGANKRVISRRCQWCYNHHKKRKETTYHCVGCESKPYLCVGKCFVEYHNNMEIS